MWVGLQAAAATTVVGAGLVVAGLHGAGVSAAEVARPVVVVVPTQSDYRPPAVRLPDTTHVHARVVAPTPQPTATRRAQARAKAAVSAARPSHRTTAARTSPKPKPAARPVSFAVALAEAVARIPTYRPGAARWVVSTKYDFWGTADWYHDVLYVSPDVPRDKLYDVAVHEWSHELSVLDYGGDVDAATKAMNAWFGGSDLVGAERAADCMAILQGATWTHYTTCTNAKWRQGAAKLVAGNQL